MQVKLLRAIQEKKVRKVVHDEEPVDSRIIARRQTPLALVESGEFRQDLYYRFARHRAWRCPSLRECGRTFR